MSNNNQSSQPKTKKSPKSPKNKPATTNPSTKSEEKKTDKESDEQSEKRKQQTRLTGAEHDFHSWVIEQLHGKNWTNKYFKPTIYSRVRKIAVNDHGKKIIKKLEMESLNDLNESKLKQLVSKFEVCLFYYIYIILHILYPCTHNIYDINKDKALEYVQWHPAAQCLGCHTDVCLIVGANVKKNNQISDIFGVSHLDKKHKEFMNNIKYVVHIYIFLYIFYIFLIYFCDIH